MKAIKLNGKFTTQYFLVLLYLAVVNSSTTPAWESGLFKLPDLRTICTYFKNVSNVNAKCAEQLNIVCRNISLLRTMMDASSKFPYTGLGYSAKIDLGNYDQCMAIDHKYKGGRILGEYCTEGLIVPDVFGNVSDANFNHVLSLCRPNACVADDYNKIIDLPMDPNFIEAFFDRRCYTASQRENFTVMDIITMSIFALIITLMISSTIYDVYLYQNKQETVHALLVSFSILSNGRKLLHVSSHSTSKENIEVFNGIRVISMLWIIAGHGFMSWDDVPVFNRGIWGNTWAKQLYAVYIVTAPLAVDTFFYISGFLVTFQYLKYKDVSIRTHILAIPKMHIHRYLRITPPLLMIYLVIISIYLHLGNGPLWNDNIRHAESCRKNWWSFLLYVQNYYNDDDMCIMPAWFLSAVMQMSLLSPFVLIPLALTLRRSSGFKAAMVELLVLNIFSVVIPVTYRIYINNNENTYETHSRLIDYLVGMTLAVFMREKINKPFLYMIKQQHRSIVNFITWVLMLILMLSTLMCYHFVEASNFYGLKLPFFCILRPFWCIGLSWIVYSCHHGYGGFINWILCRPIYQVLGRISYCIYLIHQSVIDYYTTTTRAPWFFSDYNSFYMFCGHYMVSIIVATFWTLAFESPIFAIEKFFRGNKDWMKEKHPIASSSSMQTHMKKYFEGGTTLDLFAQRVNTEGLYKENKEF